MDDRLSISLSAAHADGDAGAESAAAPLSAAARSVSYGAFRLEVEDVAVSRGGRIVAEGAGFSLGPGGWFELRGPNGGGKTSLLRCLAGLAPMEAGRVAWIEDGREPAASTRGVCAWLGHADGLQGHFTVRETLGFWSAAGAGPAPDAAMDALGLQKFADTPVRRLSAGWRRRAALARMILLDRPLWLLDEPFANLDDRAEALTADAIRAHLARGGAAIAAVHGPSPAIPGARVLRLETAA